MVSQIKHHLILVADEFGNQFDYAVDEAPAGAHEASFQDVDLWIWGTKLCY